MKRLHQEKGLTLIETTVILAVVTVLSGMLAPSILQFIEDAKITQAENDVRVISAGLSRFFQDTGHFPVTFDTVQGGLGTHFIDVLVSDGLAPQVTQARSFNRAANTGNRPNVAAAVSGGDLDRWNTGEQDFLDNHLVKNLPGFTLRGSNTNKGWNGPYLNTSIGADPWGNRYLVNVAYLDAEMGVADAQGVSKNAVFVLSAGPNQTIETPFTQPIVNAEAFGDDIGSRLR